MSFPIVFRIYAVINLLLFLALGAISLALTVVGAEFGPFPIAVHWALTLWLFVSALFWFFASKHSYHFLFSLSLMLLLMAGFWIWASFISGGVTNSNDKIGMTVLAGLAVFYVIFLVVASFYKPVVQWAPRRFSALHHGLAIGCVIVIFLAVFGIGKLFKKIDIIPVSLSYFSNAEYDDYPSVIQGDQWIQIDLDAPAMVNALTLPVASDGAVSSLRYAKVYFTDSSAIDLNLASRMIVEFNARNGSLEAGFAPVKARIFRIFPMKDANNSASPESVFQVASLSPGWAYGYFDKKTAEVFYDESSYTNYTSYEYDETYVEDAYEGTPEGNGRTLNAESLPEFYGKYIQSSDLLNSDWMFDGEGPTLPVTSATGEQKYLGMFKFGIVYMRYAGGQAIRRFREHSGYDYESQLSSLAGIPFYTSLASTYDEVNNGTEFNHINPEMINWVEKHLVLPPQSTIFGHTAQDYYDYVLQRSMRLMVLSHDYLEQVGIDSEAQAYESAAAEAGFFGPSYLYERYSSVPLDFRCSLDDWQDGSEFIGFWLRRKHDGTHDACWNALNKIMKAYDGEWLNTHELILEEPAMEEEYIEEEEYTEEEGDGGY